MELKSMSSSECLAKANEFKMLKDTLDGLYGSIDACVSSITSNELAMENTVISGKPLDEGKLVEAKGKISSISGDIGTMQAECDEKYKEWYAAYEEALKREEEKKKKGIWGLFS